MKKKIAFISIFTLLIISHSLKIYGQINDVQLYGFVHSLVVHDPPSIPVPNNETTTIYWINDIVQSTTNTFAFTGQFGQLSSHVDQLPPNDNIGFQNISTPWDSSTGLAFSASSINTILLTAANFIQWDLPTNPDPSDPMGRTIVENTETLFDWTDNQKPNMKYYIYGNWPEMDNENSFPPTIPSPSEIDEFHNISMGNIGTFDTWWLQYQDAFIASRPSLDAKLIPVGRIISQIHTQLIPNQITFDELYEDSDPHGRANTYFLAGLITYMALYEQQVPDTYLPSSLIHPAIRNNLAVINDFIWQELNGFNYPDGSSRVFYTNTISSDDIEILEDIDVLPNPVERLLTIQCPDFERLTGSIHNVNGAKIKSYENLRNGDTINIADLDKGLYFIRFKNKKNQIVTKKVFKK